MFINGRLTATSDRLIIRSPFDGELVGMAAKDKPDDVRHAVDVLATYDGSLSAERRGEILRDAAQKLRSRRHDFARSITRESGICLKDSHREVDRAYTNLVTASEEAKRIRGESLPLQVGGVSRLSLTIHEPVGVVAAITPFNRPLNQVVVKVAPAIAANNAVIVKPSEKTPLTAIALAELLVSVGLPTNMIAVVTGAPDEIGRALVGDARIAMITFTGSVQTGEWIARNAGIRKLLLELGGNDPLIVLDDADPALAAQIAAEGAFGTSGQSCRGVKRILAHRRVADDFAECLVEQTKARRCGDPLDPETDVGTLIDENAAMLVEQRCATAVRAGARLLWAQPRHGALLPPAALDDVPPDTDLVFHETFGPVAPIIRVEDLDDVLSVANATPYGLQAGIVTRDYEAFMYLASRLKVGGVSLMDGPHFDSPHIPFGGVKKSGVGREGIPYAIREMTSVKTLLLPWTGKLLQPGGPGKRATAEPILDHPAARISPSGPPPSFDNRWR